MKGKKSLTLLLLSIPVLVFAQIDSVEDYSPVDSSKVYTISQEKPVFLKGGDEGILRIIDENFTYPPAAMQDRVGGKVTVEYTVDTTGYLIDINIKQGIREDINQEALRLVRLLTPWKPGIQNNKKVKVRYIIPLYFWPDEQFKKNYLKKNSK